MKYTTKQDVANKGIVKKNGKIMKLSVFCLGFVSCKNKNLSRVIKEVSYVKSKEMEILSKPNADKSDLLKLMFRNEL